MPKLFAPLRLRQLELANRIVISPMCQYAAEDGRAKDWHLMHLATLAGSGAGLVFVEATAVAPEGRITKNCLGLYDDACEDSLRRLRDFVRAASDAPVGIQLSHAGRKAACRVPWEGGGQLSEAEGAWDRWAASDVPAKEQDAAPKALTVDGMRMVLDQYAQAAVRARRAGFDCIELQMAHGYLAHQFLSPLSNLRRDGFGGSLENRMRFPLQIFGAVRDAVGAGFPVGVRVSATDWVPQGWDVEQTAAFARALEKAGCAFIDVSSGGLSPHQKISSAPGYQVGFAARVRADVAIPVIAVGLITDAMHAEQIVEGGQADLVAIARGALYEPRWPWHAAVRLGATVRAPRQVHRCVPQGAHDIFSQPFPAAGRAKCSRC